MVSTPWISETVKELERQLKVTLFVRTTRSVQLTDAGRVFASLLTHVLDDLDDAVRVAQRMTARSGRPLTLGYVIGAGLELMPRLVRTYLERRPDQPLHSVEYDFADPTAGLRDHDVDAAIVRPPLGLAGIATLELTTEPRVACLPDGHRLARRESVSVSDLLQEPIIAAPPSPGPVARLLAARRVPDRASADRGRSAHPRRRTAHGGPRRRHQHHFGRGGPVLRPPRCRLCPYFRHSALFGGLGLVAGWLGRRRRTGRNGPRGGAGRRRHRGRRLTAQPAARRGGLFALAE